MQQLVHESYARTPGVYMAIVKCYETVRLQRGQGSQHHIAEAVINRV